VPFVGVGGVLPDDEFGGKGVEIVDARVQASPGQPGRLVADVDDCASQTSSRG
jgi:hypothetical protein